MSKTISNLLVAFAVQNLNMYDAVYIQGPHGELFEIGDINMNFVVKDPQTGEKVIGEPGEGDRAIVFEMRGQSRRFENSFGSVQKSVNQNQGDK